jgi:hypothetical protein
MYSSNVAVKRQAPLLLDCCNQMLWTVSYKLQVDILASLSKDHFYKHIKRMKLKFRKDSLCHNLSLRFATKPRAWKGAGQKCNLGLTLTLLGMQKNVREWAHTFPSGLPLWELESLWTFKFSKSDLRGQNSLDWSTPYTIEKLLKHRCLKWVHMIHLNTYNTSYRHKKGWESNCQFDSWSLKVKNRLEIHACRWCATYCWKALD